MTLYHGAPNLHQTLIPHRCGAYPDRNVVFATPSPVSAFTFAGERWTDFDICLSTNDGVIQIVEIEPGAVDRLFGGKVGFVHEFNSDGFTVLEGHPNEYVCEDEVVVRDVCYTNNILDEMISQGVDIYRYPSLPSDFPWDSRDDYIAYKRRRFGLE